MVDVHSTRHSIAVTIVLLRFIAVCRDWRARVWISHRDAVKTNPDIYVFIFLCVPGASARNGFPACYTGLSAAEQMNRTLLVRLAFAGATLLLWSTLDGAPQATSNAGYILGPDEGEVLLVRNTKVIVKADPRTGSRGMAAGTQDLGAGAGIPLHKHDNADEMLVVQKGAAMAILGDTQQARQRRFNHLHSARRLARSRTG